MISEVTVVVSVAHPVGCHIHLCEGEHRDPGVLDHVQVSVFRRNGHSVDELVWPASAVWGHKDICGQHHSLSFH